MVAQENKKACCKTQSSCSKNAKGYYTQYYGNNPQLIKEAEAWAASGAWQNGFTKARPHHSVNLVDFYLQYQKNPEQWKALFDYLAKTDLLSIPGGKHKIPGSSLTISVEDSKMIRWKSAVLKATTITLISSMSSRAWSVSASSTTIPVRPTASTVLMSFITTTRSAVPSSTTALQMNSSSFSLVTGTSPK